MYSVVYASVHLCSIFASASVLLTWFLRFGAGVARVILELVGWKTSVSGAGNLACLVGIVGCKQHTVDYNIQAMLRLAMELTPYTMTRPRVLN